MKIIRAFLLSTSASALLLTACASQSSVQQAAPASAASSAVPATEAPAATTATASKPENGTSGVSVVGSRYSGTRRVVRDGVEYFCERPAATGSHFIAPREQCYTEAQLKAVRERDQDFVRRQNEMALQTNTTAVTKTAVSP